MQFGSFEISGLFGGLHHKITFPLPSKEGNQPALVIMHGPNGVGKTTMLRMLDGMMRLDFNLFRIVPFDSCALTFAPDNALVVRRGGRGQLESIDVGFGDHQVRLHPQHPGPLEEKDVSIVEEFRRCFLEATEDIVFEFIEAERVRYKGAPSESQEDAVFVVAPDGSRFAVRGPHTNPKAKKPQERVSLASRVLRFIREAQVNYRTFFATTEPDLFPRIIERLTTAGKSTYTIEDLAARLETIRDQDNRTVRLGLEADYWDFDQLKVQLDALSAKEDAARAQALTVIGTYVEQLESRAKERALVADRLMTFERLMAQFLRGKTVTIHMKNGLQIEASGGSLLSEQQLSSGEYHLLFLMVAALVTKRRGTVVAIDEPEMSMHIGWQRRLVPALVECASGAEPLFIFATHSPDLAASFPSALIELE